MKKHIFFFSPLFCTLILASVSYATYLDTGWVEFKQPNGVTFIGRMWGDEWNYTFQTQDGYPFDKNFSDGYYYYALSEMDGAYRLSGLKVGVNAPRNIPKQLRVWIEKPESLLKSDAELAKSLTAETWTLKVILVEFQDIHGNSYWERSDFSNMLFSTDYYFSPDVQSPPIDALSDGDDVFGSLRDYYDAMSNGDLTVTGQILNDPLPGGDTPDWIRLSHDKIWYRNNSYTNLYNEAVDSADARGYDVSTGSTTKLVILYAGNFYLSNLNPRNVGSGYIM